MRARGAVALVGLLSLAAPAGAVVPRTGPLAADVLTAMPSAHLAKPLRVQRGLAMAPPVRAAWAKLAATGTWSATWDRATGVPSRIWGSGIATPGAMASPAIAEAAARAALADHLALLAPGASISDFTLVSNQSDGEIRSVGFAQRHGGRGVVGGQVSFRFKRDRLFVIGSEALPDIALPPQGRARLPAAALRDRITQTVRRDLALPDAPVTEPGDEVVLPLVGDDAVLGYRVAVAVTIDGGAAGRYLAYCDPASGETLAVRQMNLYTTGTLLYHGVDRYPGRPRIDRPAPAVHVALDGAPETTSPSGELTWADDQAETVTTSVVGDLAVVVNKASGGLATAQLALPAGGQVVWDASAVPEDDAQVQSYLSTNIAKAFARTLDPAMATLGDPITVNVNIAQDCNAFFDGKSLNFFHATARCQNTGLLQDVVFHEFGHAVHTAEIITGVGAFDIAMSEGAADFFAAQITGDPGMGRGFFYTDAPLRNLDPDGTESRWPDDIGEPHKTGLIFGGTFWDLRKALIASFGQADGVALTEKLYVGALRRSVDIPSSLIETLAADDDDGDLSNGTPHECAIRDAFGRHGLRTVTGAVDAPAVLEPPTLTAMVQLTVAGLAQGCTGDAIDHVELAWKLPSPPGSAPTASPPTTGSVVATPSELTAAPVPTTFGAELPLAADDTTQYQFQLIFQDGSALSFPDNLADPFYQLYQGRTVALYCTDFESGDPLAAGWTTESPGALSPWQWGVPTSGSTDPHAAFSGSYTLSQVLNGDYAANSTSFVQMPPIATGQWSDVHLQYRRWLAVEDSQFDRARIVVGGTRAWINATADLGDSSALQHIDREWRFQDVAVSGYQAGHTIDIAWDLTSDGGLELGGWALDDVCVVANVNGVCGDGIVTAHEACDDGAGNADAPDACRTWCQRPICGDHIVDRGEVCDDGPTGSMTCTAACTRVGPEGAGCCSADRGTRGPWALAALTLGWLWRRGRRRR